MTPMHPLIAIEGVHKVYTNDGVETAILRNISLTIHAGEFVAIMGPSGSGKSTLMHILGFLDTATSGTYFFSGRDVSTLSAEELATMRRQAVGFVFQAFFLLPQLTVLENVSLPLMYRGTPPAERMALARRAIEQVGLGHRMEYPAVKLSGGEKQRVAIARALVGNPAVIFADEPTGNLDSASGAQVMELMSTLQQNGHTVIVVTHETATAACARRIIRIRDGVLVGDAAVERQGSESVYAK